MTQIMKVAKKDLKAAIITTLSEVKQHMLIMVENMGNAIRKIETVK